MLEMVLLIIAVTLAGSASTREERAAAFQRELPQLVAACNKAFSGVGPRTRDGVKACDRLAAKKSLAVADPATVRAYVRRGSTMPNAAIMPGAGSGPYGSPTPSIGPGGVPQ
jgi:hypothetical protein